MQESDLFTEIPGIKKLCLYKQKSIKFSSKYDASAVVPVKFKNPLDVDSFVYEMIPTSGIDTVTFLSQLAANMLL